MATKVKSIRWDRTWFDLAIFLLIVVVLILLAGGGLGLKASLAIGGIAGILYLSITSRYGYYGDMFFLVFLKHMFVPGVKEQFIESTKCQNCGAEFENNGNSILGRRK